MVAAPPTNPEALREALAERCDYLVDTFPITFHGEPALECRLPAGHDGEHVVQDARGRWHAWYPDDCDCNEGGCGCIIHGEITEAEALHAIQSCPADPVAKLIAQRDAALAERDEARRALERDRSTVAKAVNKMREALRGRSWLLEGGRGPYAWDDDRFREEFSAALDEIAAPLDVLRGIARDWSNCPTDQSEIDLARAEPATAQAERTAGELAAAEARIAVLEAALKPFCFGDPALENILFGDMPDDATCTFTIKLRDTRRARAALSNGERS